MLFELNTMEMPDHRLVNSSALLIKEEFGDHYFKSDSTLSVQYNYFMASVNNGIEVL